MNLTNESNLKGRSIFTLAHAGMFALSLLLTAVEFTALAGGPLHAADAIPDDAVVVVAVADVR
jgi:hypothetical protein